MGIRQPPVRSNEPRASFDSAHRSRSSGFVDLAAASAFLCGRRPVDHDSCGLLPVPGPLPYLPLLSLVALTAVTNAIYGIWLHNLAPEERFASDSAATWQIASDVDGRTPVERTPSGR